MTTLVGGGINVIILHLLLPVLGLVAAPLGLWIGFLIIIVLRLMWLKKRALITRWRNALYYLAAFFTVTAIFIMPINGNLLFDYCDQHYFTVVAAPTV